MHDRPHWPPAGPQTMPSFAGVRPGGVYAWVSTDGLHAVKA
ncbi:hypothetical protein [Actinomadura barringtoniae]|nr:hypothetical protein [Actinomadura barringtoniae]